MTGVQTCALPICQLSPLLALALPFHLTKAGSGWLRLAESPELFPTLALRALSLVLSRMHWQHPQQLRVSVSTQPFDLNTPLWHSAVSSSNPAHTIPLRLSPGTCSNAEPLCAHPRLHRAQSRPPAPFTIAQNPSTPTCDPSIPCPIPTAGRPHLLQPRGTIPHRCLLQPRETHL